MKLLIVSSCTFIAVSIAAVAFCIMPRCAQKQWKSSKGTRMQGKHLGAITKSVPANTVSWKTLCCNFAGLHKANGLIITHPWKFSICNVSVSCWPGTARSSESNDMCQQTLQCLHSSLQEGTPLLSTKHHCALPQMPRSHSYKCLQSCLFVRTIHRVSLIAYLNSLEPHAGSTNVKNGERMSWLLSGMVLLKRTMLATECAASTISPL